MGKLREHCKRGHALSGENVHWTGLLRNKRSCLECDRIRNRKWNEGHREKTREKARLRRLAKPEYTLEWTYHISQRQFDEFLIRQHGRCPCGLIFSDRGSGDSFNIPRIDHDHACCQGYRSCGKCIRGLLCHRCNVVLGLFEKRGDVDLLPDFLKAYLNRPVLEQTYPWINCG